MGVFNWVRLVPVVLFALTLMTGVALGAQTRPGKFVTIEGQEISFFRMEDRNVIKGWLSGTAIDVPIDTVSQIVFFDSPNVNYSMFGNDISTGEIELTRKSDNKKFILQDAFLPSDCDCTYLTYTFRNAFTDETSQGNTAIDGLRKIIFLDGENR